MVFERLHSYSSEEKSIGNINMEKEFDKSETIRLIKRFAYGLSAKQRMIFLLRDMQDFTIEEVREITGMSESAIKTNLFYARQNIRKKLIKLGINI